jgi:hypothetical protein
MCDNRTQNVTNKRRQDQSSEMASKKRNLDAGAKLTTTNSYESLPDDDEGDMEIGPTTSQKQKQKPDPMPPIVLVTELKSPKDTYVKIASWLKGRVHFKVIRDRRLVYTYNKADFLLVQEKFRELQFQFHTYTLKDEIPKKLILRGIDPIFTVEEIYNDLFEQYGKVLKVFQLKSPDQKTMYNLYLVHFQ